MKLSRFGKKFTAESTTVSLMDDLGEALTVNPDLLLLGGGNPARIPEAETVFRGALQNIVHDSEISHQMLGVYQAPQGDPALRDDLARLLNRECGWQLSAGNIAIANGSQSAFTVLFNLFAGEYTDGRSRQVQLPVVPEYVGYADVGLNRNFFHSTRPVIETIDEHTFKYHVDFEALEVGRDTGLLCASRPTNPTGNVLTDSEVEQLSSIALAADIPFVIDGAYGTPFPNIIFTKAKPVWTENTILVLSLSKLGLPGARTGIVIANQDVIAAFSRANTILSLACGNLGPAIARELIRNKQLMPLSNNVLKPFYQTAVQQAQGWVKELFAGLDYRLHRPEGAFFLWLWFPGLPISSKELYRRLKQKGVLVLAGEDFFVGLDEDWQHKHECIRVTYCQPPEVVRRGLEVIAREVRSEYEK